MTSPQGRTQRTSHGRIAGALCTAAVVALAFGGNLAGPAAEQTTVPREPVTAAPTQVAPDSTTVPGAPAADPTPPPPPGPPASPAADDPTPSRPDSAPDPPASSSSSQRPPRRRAASPLPDENRPEEVVSSRPVEDGTQEDRPDIVVASRPADPLGRPAPPPFGMLAGPADPDTRAALAECPEQRPLSAAEKKAEAKRRLLAKRRAARARKAGGAGRSGAADRSARASAADAEACERALARSTATLSPDRAARHDRVEKTPLRNAEGVPTIANPSLSLALPGPIPVGVPNFFIDRFRIPPFLLPIYQAAGTEYGVKWEILAAINEIETDYGRNLNISSAGALGWMQFMPATWKQYGTDANRDGRKDPFNPVDAIFAAARYLRAAGADHDLRRAIFAYNHADWYVESVLMRARLIGGMPSDLVGSLNGLTQGHFPVVARARYADDLAERASARRARASGNVARTIEADETRRGIDIFAAAGSPAIAVQDGTIAAIGRTQRLGAYVKLRDAYGNTYTYAHLKQVSRLVPVPKPKTQSRASIARELALPGRDPKPTRAASSGRPTKAAPVTPALNLAASASTAMTTALAKERLFAHPGRRAAFPNGGAQQIREAQAELAHGDTLSAYFTGAYGLDPEDVVLKRMMVGRRVIAGTILGRIGRTSKKVSPRLHFEIRPAGRGAPRVDPKPILDGWKLLESTALYRAEGRNAFVGGGPSIGQILLMSKETLTQQVLANPRIELYSCGRRDIEAGVVDRRVLATLEFLAASGLEPTVTSLRCGHGYYTASGNVSEHTVGSAVDIAKINGIPILGHQGAGSIADITIRRLLTLQGTVKPHQIISLMQYDGNDNTLALGDHADHIHVGFRPEYRKGSPVAAEVDAVLKPSQWIKLIDRLGSIDNPSVDTKASKYAIPVAAPRASTAHHGE